MSNYFGGTASRRAYELTSDAIKRNWCETAGCMLGWATTHTEIPPKPCHFSEDEHGQLYFDIDKYGADYFPSACFNGDWQSGERFEKVFGACLSDDIEEAEQRALDMIRELEAENINLEKQLTEA